MPVVIGDVADGNNDEDACMHANVENDSKKEEGRQRVGRGRVD